jgi:hypothetical protein
MDALALFIQSIVFGRLEDIPHGRRWRHTVRNGGPWVRSCAETNTSGCIAPLHLFKEIPGTGGVVELCCIPTREETRWKGCGWPRCTRAGVPRTERVGHLRGTDVRFLTMSLPKDIRQACYAVPTRSDMAVLMILFNPTSSVRIVQNWLFVWNRLRAAGIPVFGAELLYPWQRDSFFAPEFKTITVRSSSIMFHKEKLLERLVREVPESYTKLCAIDCDIVFQRPDWYDAVSAALDEAPVVQPYDRCMWMSADLRRPLGVNPSAVAVLPEIRAQHATGVTNALRGHPGFAMAMRRSVHQFVWAVVGGGDAMFLRGVAGLTGNLGNNQRMNDMLLPGWNEWAATAHTDVSFAAGGIWHMWHGPREGRQYQDRYEKFVAAVPPSVKDVREILVENEDGVWEWREDVRKELNGMMLRYFAGRDDDSV